MDIIIIIILIYTISKGFRLGLILSIFNMIQVILSIIITKRYYPYVYGYINNNPKVFNDFKIITEFILKTLFYTKNKEEMNFIPNLISKGLLKIIISIFAMIILYWLTNILISIFLEFFSFILKTPVLKELNKVGGIIFGMIEGLFLIYILFLVISPIVSIFPNRLLGKHIRLFYL